MRVTKDEIHAAFNGSGSIAADELAGFFRTKDPAISDDAIRQRITRLKQSGFLAGLGKGIYTISNKPRFDPQPDAFITKLSKLFTKSYSGIKFCIWSSAWLNDFMTHQPAQFFYLFETEQDMVETSFHLLKDNDIHAWLQPDRETVQLYVMGQKNAVIVKPLVSRAPVINTAKASLPTLEKMLVDAFAEKDLFYYLKGQELTNIFERAIARYLVSWSKLYSYANRRGLKEQIEQFIKDNPDIQPD
jgi:hypothetical protein